MPSSSVCINVESSEAAFEQSLARRMREELDALKVAGPAARPQSVRAMRIALSSAAALAVGVALLLGTIAVFASGSPDPRVWIKDAQRSLGAPLAGEHSPMNNETAAEPGSQPESVAQASAGEHDSPSPAAADHETREPARPESPQSPEPVDRSPSSAGDG